MLKKIKKTITMVTVFLFLFSSLVVSAATFNPSVNQGYDSMAMQVENLIKNSKNAGPEIDSVQRLKSFLNKSKTDLTDIEKQQLSGGYTYEIEPNDTIAMANSYVLGTSSEDFVPVAGTLGLYDLDYYRINITNSGTLYYVGVSQDTLKLAIGICDSSGNIITGSVDDDYNGDCGYYIRLNPGTYYIVAMDLGDEYDVDYYDTYMMGAFFQKDGDTTAPQVVTYSPGNNSTNNPVNSQIYVQYNENIAQGSQFSSISVQDNNYNIIPVNPNISGSILNISLINPLEYGKTYTVTIPGYAINDIYGNPNTYGLSYSFSVEAYKSVAGVSLSNNELTLFNGKSFTLKAYVQPVDATNKRVTWSSSNQSVATVDQNGNVSAVGEGTSVITVTTVEGNYTAQCKVTVMPTPVISKIRYGGETRFGTAIEVSKGGWTASDNVILVNAYGFPDALTGVPFAQVKDSPILLTEPNSLTYETYNEIVRLNAKNIYILGGTGVVSQGIEDNLRNLGYNVYRIAGAGRFETATAIAEQVIADGGSKTAVLTTAYNYPDALAISPYAAINKMPILYTNPISFTDITRSFIVQKEITKVIIPGGFSAVSLAIENELRGMGIEVQRIAGANRYSTAFSIVNTFKSSFNNNVMLATGANFPDALAGGALAAKLQIPILLVEQNSIDADSEAYIRSKGSINLYILGGSRVIGDNIIN